MSWKRWMAVTLVGIIVGGQAYAQGEVETWTQVRGVDTPGTTYSSFIQTDSGRLLAAGRSGQLMLSDDGGTTWEYRVIRVDDEPFFGLITDMIGSSSRIDAVAIRLVSGSDDIPLQGQTLLLSSSDNGDSWSVNPFPFDSASFFGLDFPGLALTGLHRDVTGNLLAYGTTHVSGGAVLWSIGGAVFRRAGNWDQAYFALGPINTMANGNGRVIAGGFQTLIDSPDGAAWNGYFLRNANLQANGTALDTAVRLKLDITDLAFQGGEFVMAAQTYVPIPGNPLIFSNVIDQAFTFSSANPFDGSRTWVGAEQSRIYPHFQQRGGSLFNLFQGVSQSNGTNGWIDVDTTVSINTRSYGPVDSQSIVAVGSSDEVWRSDDEGANWAKILDRPFVPDLQVRLAAGNLLFATRQFGDMLWASRDNGLTWFELSDFRAQTGRFPEGLSFSGNRLFAGTGDGDRIAYSDDLGLTWTAVDLPVTSSADLEKIIVGENGRLIAAPEARPAGIDPVSPFFYSDDNGETWTATEVNIRFGEIPADGVSVGNGRLILVANGATSLDPVLFVSDDNGESWRREDPFQGLDDLNRVFNDSDQRLIELRRIVRSNSGRLLIRGADEILTSDDQGDTWQVRLNLDLRNAQGLESNLLWRLWGLEQVGDRWILLGSRLPRRFGQLDGLKFVMISEDDGNTWREVILPIDEDQELEHLISGLDGRLVASGNQGGIYVTNFELEPGLQPTDAVVREGESTTLEIPRPPLDGNIDAVYFSTPLEAQEVTDFITVNGTLSWASDDESSQFIVVETVDDDIQEPEETLTLDLYVDSDLQVSTKFIVTIEDDDGGVSPGVDLIDGQSIVTTESGGSDIFRLALMAQPTANVTIRFDNQNPQEISLSTNSLTFTEANWKDEQDVTVTGLDDNTIDGNVTATIAVSIESDDTNYQDTGLRLIGVINVDNDAVLFADSFEDSN